MIECMFDIPCIIYLLKLMNCLLYRPYVCYECLIFFRRRSHLFIVCNLYKHMIIKIYISYVFTCFNLKRGYIEFKYYAEAIHSDHTPPG